MAYCVPSQRLRPYPLLTCRAGRATELDTPLQRAQYQVINAEKYADIEQSQSEQGVVVTVRDEMVVAQPINEPQQPHMDKQTKQEIKVSENSRAFLAASGSWGRQTPTTMS